MSHPSHPSQVSHLTRALILLCAGLLALFSFTGCSSFDVTQTCRFVNDAGEFVEVDYCTGKEEHVNTFYVPRTGKTLEFKSKLRVKVRLENESFKAYQCMNFMQSGTLYQSDDKEWLFHANGFTCAVWRAFADPKNRNEDRPSYKKVFAGVLSQSPRGAN